MTETDKAYIAGIVDGEGCISIRLLSNRVKGTDLFTGIDRCHGYARVQICNTSESMIEFIDARFKGKRRLRQRTLANHKPIHEWELTSKPAIAFLELIAPYLVVKWRQAELAKAFRLIQDERPTGMGASYSDEQVTAKREIILEMRGLNAMGRRNSSVMREV